MPYSKLLGILVVGALLVVPFSFSTDITKIQSVAFADNGTSGPPPVTVAPASTSNTIGEDDIIIYSGKVTSRAETTSESLREDATSETFFLIVKKFFSFVFVSLQV
ncbi:MAG: hypothetical protein IIB00_04835 [candidate division Zixibacteria bacterium]|nr:hypothetical protein [candidate division Zixibacteria bacterium]